MNLRDLRYVVAVADHAHFGKAAQACSISQPTLSGQILKLERELGVELFERDGRTVDLTSAGALILAHARRAVTAADDMIAAAAAHRDPEAAPLRLGIIPTLAPYLIPVLLPAIQANLNRLRLTLVEDLTDRLIEPLHRGALDAALIASEPGEAGLREQLLFQEPFWLVMRADHPLAGLETVATTQVDARSLLLLQDGHCLRDQAIDLCQRPRPPSVELTDMRASSLDTLLQMVEAGFGMTLMPHLAIVRDTPLPRNVVARRLEGARTSRCVRMVSRANSARHATIDRVAELVRSATGFDAPP